MQPICAEELCSAVITPESDRHPFGFAAQAIEKPNCGAAPYRFSGSTRYRDCGAWNRSGRELDGCPAARCVADVGVSVPPVELEVVPAEPG